MTQHTITYDDATNADTPQTIEGTIEALKERKGFMESAPVIRQLRRYASLLAAAPKPDHPEDVLEMVPDDAPVEPPKRYDPNGHLSEYGIIPECDVAEQPETVSRCEDCPPVGYPTDETRCAPCDRRAAPIAAQPWQALAAALYQAAGAYNMPVRFLDALSAAANGEPFAHLIDGLLPVEPPVQPTVKQSLTTEREAFEKWARTADMALGMYSGTDYADGATQISWDAWQARAALAQQPNAQDREDAERWRYGSAHDRFPKISGRSDGSWWLMRGFKDDFKSAEDAIDAARAKGADHD